MKKKREGISFRVRETKCGKNNNLLIEKSVMATTLLLHEAPTYWERASTSGFTRSGAVVARGSLTMQVRGGHHEAYWDPLGL